MAQARLPVRKIREVLRLKWELGLSDQQIANRLRETSGTGRVTTFAYAPASNRLTALDQTPVTLDAAGHTTALAGETFTYNPAGRLATVFHHGRWMLANTYDAFGTRVLRTTPQGVTVFHSDPTTGTLLTTTTGAGAPIDDVLTLQGIPVALIHAGARGDALSPLLTDGTGTPRAAVTAPCVTVVAASINR